MNRAPRYARHVSRIGALAVVLGVGAAAITSPQPVSADPTPSPGPSSPEVPGVEAQQEPSAPTPGPAVTEGPGPEPEGIEPDKPEQSGDQHTVIVGDSPSVTYSSSGGALTSGTDEEDDAVAPLDAPAPAPPSPVATPTSVPTPVEAPPSPVQRLTAVATALGARLDKAPLSTGDPGAADPQPDTAGVNVLPAVGAPGAGKAGDVAAHRRLSTVVLTPAYPDAVTETVARRSDGEPPDAGVFAVPTASSSAGLRALPGSLINVASGFLTAALSPFVVPRPELPADPPTLWLLLAWVRRQFTGQATAVSCAAPDADRRLGSVKLTLDEARPLHAAGTSMADGATRSFLEDLVALFTRLVQGGLAVDADTPYTVDSVDRRSGAVTGSVHVDGPDTAPLTFAMFDPPATGAATVDPLTGKWTFTPTPPSRVQAFAISGAAEVTFAVIASLGRAATAPIVVSAPVQGAESAAYPALPGVPVRGVRLAPNDIGFQVIVRHNPLAATYETAVAIIDPANPAATVTVPVTGALSRFAFAPDHTAYSTTVVAQDPSDRDVYAVTAIKASGESVTIPIAGIPVGDLVFGPDGRAYQTSYRHDATTDTYVTTVTVVSADGHHVDASIDGHPAGFGFGADGAVYQVTELRPFALDEAGNETTVAAIDPAGATTTLASIPGAALEFAQAPDGAVVQTTRAAGPHGFDYTLTRIPANGAEPQSFPLSGAIVGSVAFTPAGATMVTVRTPAGSDVPGEVVVVGPTGALTAIALPARPRGGIELAADGTARQSLRSGDVAVIDPDTPRLVDVLTAAHTASVAGPDGTVYAHHDNGPARSVVELTRRDGTTTAIEADGALFTSARGSNAYSVMQGVRFAPDGTPYLFTGTREAAPFNPFFGDYDGLTVTVIDPATATATPLPVAGGDNGFLKFVSDSAFAYFAPIAEKSGVTTAVTFVDLAAARADTVHIDGYFTDYAVGDDGTSYVVTNTDFDPVSATTGRAYAMTVASADGSMWTTSPIDGTPYEAMVTGPDGTVYQVVENTDGLSTGVIVSHPGSLTFVRIDLDGYPQSPVVFDSAGTGYVTTGTVDPGDGELRTVVTVVAVPTGAAVAPAKVATLA
ncbi:hypothetical protein SAMN04489835_3393 [Mycolicibacterium rutilum]|uniref:Uncharacterized protein n=1 Tax=Mycolicibacterium rutilum TaxID=370526 RepID=A0A1H6KCW5_MYCRU|nr:hypothetical protein [Mycolicibacterium rutilum]SEH73059.1 hypothetical protein SAMN04489835_3393 [Mycolicibacterium rutilum]